MRRESLQCQNYRVKWFRHGTFPEICVIKSMEIWIRSNRRALLIGMLVPLVIVIVGACFVWSGGNSDPNDAGLILGWGSIAIGIALSSGLLWMMLLPRVAYRNGQVLFFLRLGRPIRVPIEAVEIFLVGQSTAGHGPKRDPAEVANLLVRLADRQKEWHNCQVHSVLADWKDGYVTLRGTWCEPVSPTLLKKLNRRLAELRRAREGV